MKHWGQDGFPGTPDSKRHVGAGTGEVELVVPSKSNLWGCTPPSAPDDGALRRVSSSIVTPKLNPGGPPCEPEVTNKRHLELDLKRRGVKGRDILLQLLLLLPWIELPNNLPKLFTSV